MTDVALADVSLSALEERWSLSRNSVKNRAKALGVTILNPTPKSAFWPGEFIDLGDQLHAWIQAGNELAAFPYIQQIKEGGSAAISKQTAGSKLAKKATSQLAVTPRFTLPEGTDPFSPAEDLYKAVGLKRWYSTDEMALILRKPRTTLANWEHRKEVRPDVFLEKRKVGNDVYWRAVTDSSEATLTPQPVSTDSSEISRIHPGERMLAAIDVHFRDVTGSDLFNSNRIVG